MRATIFTVTLVLAGCAVGPDFKPPALSRDAGYPQAPLIKVTASTGNGLGASQHFVEGVDIVGDWWTLFGCKPLDDLVARAIKANPNLEAAQAALRAARENTLAQKGSWFPQVSAGLAANRNLTPTAALSPTSPTGNPYYSLITPQLNVSFVPDVFGANRRAVESLEAQAENARYQLQATYVTLASNVVTGALQEASIRDQIAATEETVKIESDLLAILRRQYQAGQVSMADVAAQQAALAQAMLALPSLHKQLAQQRDALIALLGAYPSHDLGAQFHLADLHLPRDLPVSLPSNLVEQRPDVRAAEQSLHAASAQIGVAIAAPLPQITLNANLGNSAGAVANLFTPGTNFWTIGAGLIAPIFAGGTLLHKQRAAEATFEEVKAQYRATVIAAFQNVADALYALQADADAVVAASAAELAAAQSLAIVRKQLELGQVAYLALLNAEQTHQTAKLALVTALASRLIDTTGLYQALGGGWWHGADDRLAGN